MCKCMCRIFFVVKERASVDCTYVVEENLGWCLFFFFFCVCVNNKIIKNYVKVVGLGIDSDLFVKTCKKSPTCFISISILVNNCNVICNLETNTYIDHALKHNGKTCFIEAV